MHGTLVVYGILLVAVMFEVLDASFLEKSGGLVHIFFIILSLLCYGLSFVFGAYTLKTMPVAVMYAVWCGIGIILSAFVGYFINHQRLDPPAIIGMALIGVGVVVIYWFSKSVA